jgi:predicted dehydrogenase
MPSNPSKNRHPLRGALLGFGNVAIHAHLPLWQRNNNFRIDAVVEPFTDQARLVRGLLPEAALYRAIDSLLARHDLDFVDICTPPCFHAELALAACRSGLHVFCEKPLVTTIGSLLEIEQAAAACQRVVFTVNNWKHAPLWRRALQLIRQGAIGSVRGIDLTVLRPPNSGGGTSNWRICREVAGGGILLDHGWHHLYLILTIVDEPPLRISARMDYAPGDLSCLEETVDLVIQFRSGAEARLHLTWRASCRRNYGTVEGDRGRLLINDDHLVLCRADDPPLRHDFPEALSGGSHHLEWMEPVVEGFFREILDAESRGANLMESKWCALLTCLAYQSHQEGSRFMEIGDPSLQEFPWS